jgi:hypothetical protein
MRSVAIVILWVALSIIPVNLGYAQQSPSKNEDGSMFSLLAQQYDVRPKYKKGDKRYYRLVILYKRLEPSGKLLSFLEHRGDIERVVDSVQSDGKAYEIITWKNVAHREIPEKSSTLGPWKKQPWVEGFSYRFSAEDSHQKFHWNYQSFPKTMEGYLSLMLTVDAHFEFDYLRSSFHGAIEKLRRIGDEVEAPDSHLTFTVNFPPVVPSSHLRKRNVYTKFIGLTQINGEPCAILAHRQGPGEFLLNFAASPTTTASHEITSSFWGNLMVRLSNGSLVYGDFIEQVRAQVNLPGQDKPTFWSTQAEYRIDEISSEVYMKGLTTSTNLQ